MTESYTEGILQPIEDRLPPIEDRLGKKKLKGRGGIATSELSYYNPKVEPFKVIDIKDFSRGNPLSGFRLGKGRPTMEGYVGYLGIKKNDRQINIPIIKGDAEVFIPIGVTGELEKSAFIREELLRRSAERRAGREGPKGEVLACLPNDIDPDFNLNLLELKQDEMENLTREVRDQALMVMALKLQMLANDKKELKRVTLSDLARTFGMLFDKKQLMDGKSTKNVSIKKQVDHSMSSKDLLEQLQVLKENE